MIIYLGPESNGWLSSEVLRFTLEKFCDEPIEFKEVKDLFLDLPLNAKPGSPFYRWFIPYFEKYKGKVLYLDPSMVALGDIAPIFKLDMKGKGALAKAVEKPSDTEGFYTGVVLMDCEKLKNWDPESWLKALSKDNDLYQKTNWALPGGLNHDQMGFLSDSWHQIDIAPEGTKLIHYANPTLKPWRTPNHPEKNIFLSALKEAVEKEYIPLETLLLEIQAGRIYSQILEEAMASNSSHS